MIDLAQRAGPAVDVPPDRILSELRKREELGSTGVGGGVAIPHARFHQLSKPLGMLLRLKKAIDFDAVDGKPVDTVFLLLLPERSDGDQLGALACIARKLRDPATIAAVRAHVTVHKFTARSPQVKGISSRPPNVFLAAHCGLKSDIARRRSPV